MEQRRLPGIPVIAFFLALVLMAGCGSRQISSDSSHSVMSGKRVARMGYTIQVGAFSQVENAARLVNALNSDNLDAYYFRNEKGLYKVRFGSFASREGACREAEILKAMEVIGAFYIVRPDEYSITKSRNAGETYIRDEVVKTARGFIGVPYRWGGSSTEEGFDCSGLAMAIYRLNGLKLPRTSGEQFRAGTEISRNKLEKGDLVFFDTRGRGRISHVGIYIGRNQFIHAPRTGKTVSTCSLSQEYYQKRYAGARSYL